MKSTNIVALCLMSCLATSAFGQVKPRNSDFENIGSRDINKGQINFVSREKEVALGRQLAAEFERLFKISDNAVVNEYINHVGQNLTRHSDAQLPISFKVVDSDEVNGRTFPGGFIYINTGTILAADNEAELASVLAQQIAHIAARHSTESASKAELINFANVPLVFQGGGFEVRQTGGFTMPAQFAVEVRKQVTEADYLGLQYLYQAGYAAQAAITFLQKLQAIQPATSNARVFNSEPPLAQRIAAIQKNIELLLPPRAQDVENTSEFNSIKAQLRR